jgi:bacterioferritin
MAVAALFKDQAVTHADIITHLNALLKAKLTGINQYFLHARMLKHKGVVKLADYEYKASIDAMKHADMLVEHILTLGGMPQLQELDPLAVGATETEMLAGDFAHADKTLKQLNDTLELCKTHGDQVTAALLGRIAEAQREHVDCIRNQMNPPTKKECA